MHVAWPRCPPLHTSLRFHQNSFEVFGRLSYTSGDADDDARSDLSIATVGGSWYHRNIRGSLNLFYARSNDDFNDQDDGYAATARIQYLF